MVQKDIFLNDLEGLKLLIKYNEIDLSYKAIDDIKKIINKLINLNNSLLLDTSSNLDTLEKIINDESVIFSNLLKDLNITLSKEKNRP